MEILTRNKCTTCNGEGMISNGIWLKYYEAETDFKKQHGRIMDEQETYLWFQKEGVYAPLPNEEIQCTECNGTGHVESWITIEQFMKVQTNSIFKYLTDNAGK